MAQFATAELLHAPAAHQFQQLGFDQLRLNRVLVLGPGERNDLMKLLLGDGG